MFNWSWNADHFEQFWTMDRNLGELIRIKIRDDHRSVKFICAELGMTRGNLDKIYKKDSINTDLLARISALLDFDFFRYVNPFRKEELEMESPTLLKDGSATFSTPKGKLYKCLQDLHESQKDLDHIEKQFGQLKAHVYDKNQIIELQRDKIKLLEQEIQALKGA